MPQRAIDPWAEALDELEEDWPTWVCTIFGPFISAPFAPHHQDFWRHVWSMQRGVRARPFIGCWNRGGAKSSSVEMAVAALGATGRRRYCLYVSRSQDQADDHVASIASLLEAPEMAAFYPGMASRRLGKYGQSRGWRVNRLWTASGFVVDAIGLDKATRGVKLEDVRPDLLCLDDLDEEDDTERDVERIIRRITKRLLPAGSRDLSVIGVQNKIHDDSVFARLVDGRADFLHDRIVSGPIPAVENLEVQHVQGRYTIVGGTPTWEGMDLTVCQAKMDEWSYSAFMSEAQHETEPPPGGMFSHLDFEALHVRWEDVPALVEVVTACDPAVTNTDQSDSHGVQIDGLATDGWVYRLYSWEHRATPVGAIRVAIRKGAEYGGTKVIIETDQGGDTWGSVFREAKEAVVAEVEAELLAAAEREEMGTVERLSGLLVAVQGMTMASDKAGSSQMSKAARAQNWILPEYERPGPPIRHVLGTHNVLERALRRFPRYKPHDLCLAGGTLVVTGHGERRLDEIAAGERVLTRAGWRRVLWAGCTGRAVETVQITVGEATLQGTPEHPIWTENRGWVPLGQVVTGDSIGLWDGKRAPWTGASAKPRPGAGACSTTSDGGAWSTVSNHSVRSPAPSMAATAPSMHEASASPIGSGGEGGEILLPAERSGQGRASTRRSPSGVSLIAAIHGPRAGRTASTTRRSDRMLRSETSSIGTFTAPLMARFLMAVTSIIVTGMRSTTRLTISFSSRSRSIGRSMGLRGKTKTPCAPTWHPFENSPPSGTAAKRGDSGIGSTHGVISPAEPAGRMDVYNLVVEGQPEFIANGLLVHNCDAGAWSLRALRRPATGGSAADYLAQASTWRRR